MGITESWKQSLTPQKPILEETERKPRGRKKGCERCSDAMLNIRHEVLKQKTPL